MEKTDAQRFVDDFRAISVASLATITDLLFALCAQPGIDAVKLRADFVTILTRRASSEPNLEARKLLTTWAKMIATPSKTPPPPPP